MAARAWAASIRACTSSFTGEFIRHTPEFPGRQRRSQSLGHIVPVLAGARGGEDDIEAGARASGQQGSGCAGLLTQFVQGAAQARYNERSR
ncbi:hypothetical protein TPA0910_30050 [Streptomyces hygroscopicus subsp. sporocinereus]|uniref:Uncharacterized protein n=1 Tax=Streptomyces hygroscopicus TaxID=1912 RepID=A0ABQ3TZM1_STRHY|nr:hypothetical protein TPA0910_30050 [Streptomyces hygroscopicus]